VGINTAIVTTSGSSAGIGFAVPADQIKPVVEQFLRQDRIDRGQRPNQGWLGVSIVRQEVVKVAPEEDDSGQDGTSRAARTTVPIPMIETKNWIFKVERNSPASEAGLRPLAITEAGIVQYGDAIVAVGGNEVRTFEELNSQFEDRVVGEKVALTVENSLKERRVVYVTLARRPVTKQQ
jgi:S1-C subfamily serine protease